MRRWLMVLLGCGLIISTTAVSADEKKDAEKKESPKVEKKESKEKLGAGGTVVGKVVGVEASQRLLTLQLSQSVPSASGRSVKLINVNKNVEFQLADDVKVRTLQPPVQYDDKGNAKKTSAKDLKALKGDDTKSPGYPADMEMLKRDQIVCVYLAKAKPPAKPVAKSKTKDKDLAGEVAAADKPIVQLIEIRHEAAK